MGTSYAEARRGLERLFLERGLPRRIRSDNGSPFASIGTGRLSLRSPRVGLKALDPALEVGQIFVARHVMRLDSALKYSVETPAFSDPGSLGTSVERLVV